MSTDSVQKGLEDITVAETRLSRIDGEAGELIIGGYPLDELAREATFEETVYLLRHDRLPTADELTDFRAELAGHRELPDGTRAVLRAAAQAGKPPMDALRMGMASANLDQEKDDPERDATLLVAQTPTIVATYWRLRNDEEPLDPRTDLSHAANYLYMLTGEEPSDAQIQGLETYLNAVSDHGLNASTFTARAIVSTEADVVSAVTGAIGALKGPLHGGAPGPVLDMLTDIQESGDAESYIRETLEAGDRIMGFGHRVYTVRDPRAAVLSEAAEAFYDKADDSEFFALARDVEDTASDLLADYKPDQDLNTNVEFYTAVLLHGIGIPNDLFTTNFAIARVGGWTAHCIEQLADNRLIRPRGKYIGATGRTWSPVEQR
jgi:citrate synthase